MRTFAFTAAALFVAVVPAQDVISWVDASTTDRCRVSDFTVLEVKWQTGSGTDRKSSDLVASLQVTAVAEKYRRGYAAKEQNAADTPDQFLAVARAELPKSPFLAQFGFWEAGKILYEAGKPAEAFAVFEELIEKLPDSGFVPRAIALKLEYYLGGSKAKSAEKVARDYNLLATTKSFPDGYLRESEYYLIMAQAAGGSLKAADMRNQLDALSAKCEGRYPSVAHRCRLQVAHSLRGEGKLDEALSIYNRIIADKAADRTSLAGAQLGLGHVQLSRASESNKDAYRAALMAFLRVYVEAQDAAPDLVAEALYHGYDASLKWGGTDHRLVASRLRHVLRTDARFNETDWAKKL